MAERVRLRGRVWYYRFVDADGVRREARGCGDRRVTEQMLAAAELEAAKIREGLVDPKEVAYKAHDARPLAEHLGSYASHMLDRNLTQDHVDLSVARVRRVVAIFRGASLAEIEPANSAVEELARAASTLTAWVAPARLSDLTTERVQMALRQLRDNGKSLGTCNHYATAVLSFAGWLYDTRRLRENPLRGIEKYNAKEDRRRDRRTIAVEDLRRLIEVAQQGAPYRRMTGPMRALCYQLASATGLRFSEIASITPESFNWDAPSVAVKAAYTKNGDPAVMPLPRGLADDLTVYVATLEPSEPIFPMPSDGRGAEMLRVDLEAAGIPYRDAAGLVFDFHSLRCETATLADAAGVSPRVVQKMMRHSTLELTGRYTKPRVVDIEAAANMLPSLKPSGPSQASHVLAATGTDDGFAPRQLSNATGPDAANAGNPGVDDATHRETLAPYLRHTGDVPSRPVSSCGEMAGSGSRSSTGAKDLGNKGFVAPGRLESPSDAIAAKSRKNEGRRSGSPAASRSGIDTS